MSTISASTTTTTAYKVTADTTGTLVLQTGATPTTAMTISSAQVVNFANAPTVAGSPLAVSAATPTALGTVYGSMTTSGASPYLTALGYNAAAANTSGPAITAIGVSALAANTIGTYHTAVGYQALSSLSNTSSSGVTALGYQAGLNYNNADSVSSSTFLGFWAGKTTTTGTDNTFVGSQAGQLNLTGGYNTAMGSASLQINSTGSYNIAIGVQALRNSTTNYNNALGYRAGYSITTGDSNNAFGYLALSSNSTTSDNSAFGHQALLNSTGGSNTAMGSNSLYANTSGAFNTAIGVATLRLNTTANNNTAIGYQAGYSVTGTGNTCLGALAGQDTAPITSGTNNTILGAFCRPSSGTDNNEIVIGYNVSGVGSTTVTIGSASGKIYNSYASSATWTQTSDVRLKTNVQNDTLGLSFINRLRPVKFNWKASNEIEQSLPYYNEVNERDTTTVIHGLIAQEVKEALDAEGVGTFAGWDQGPDGIQAISREMFITPLIKAIQELKAELDAAKAEIAALKGAA
jgi:trimeric autotransporter adhesin